MKNRSISLLLALCTFTGCSDATTPLDAGDLDFSFPAKHDWRGERRI